MGDFGELIESDTALYRFVLAQPARTVPELAEALELTSDDVDKSVARLTELGLLRHGDDETLTGVSPMLAEATVLGAEDLELGARRAAVEQRRDTIRRLVPDWNTAFTTTSMNETAVEVISDQSAMANILMHYAGQCEQELMSVAPGRLPWTRIDGRTRVANVYSARRGIKTRALYQHTALRDRATRAYLNELAQNGTTIRFASSVPGRSLVVDRKVALLPIPTDDRGRHGLAIVREPNVLTWMIATFEQLWAEASPLEEVIDRQHDETELDQTRAAILRLMAEGEKDEAISRRLSISVRTCRRHIADYMAQVGATSRFQAGVIAARAGHTDSPARSERAVHATVLVLVIVLAVTNAVTLVLLVLLYRYLDGPTHEPPDPVVAGALEAGTPARGTGPVRRIVSVEVLNPIELAGSRGRWAGIAGSLAPRLTRRIVHDQVIKILREQLVAQQVVADVRLHTVRPVAQPVAPQVYADEVAPVQLGEPPATGGESR